MREFLLVNIAWYSFLGAFGCAMLCLPAFRNVVLLVFVPLAVIVAVALKVWDRFRHRRAKTDLLRGLEAEGFQCTDQLESYGLLLVLDRSKPALCFAKLETERTWGYCYTILCPENLLSGEADEDSEEDDHLSTRRTRVRSVGFILRLAEEPPVPIGFPLFYHRKGIDAQSSRVREARRIAKMWELMTTLVAAGQPVAAFDSNETLQARVDALIRSTLCR